MTRRTEERVWIVRNNKQEKKIKKESLSLLLYLLIGLMSSLPRERGSPPHCVVSLVSDKKVSFLFFVAEGRLLSTCRSVRLCTLFCTSLSPLVYVDLHASIRRDVYVSV